MDSYCLMSRQPIFRSEMDVAAYELSSQWIAPAGRMEITDTERSIFGMLTDTGLDSILGGFPGFISIPLHVLSEGLWKGISSSRVILGYFDDFAPSDPAYHQLSRLVAEGYRIALSDRLSPESLELLGDLAEVIKVDVTKYLPNDLQERVKELRRYQTQILAERVDTYDDLEFCKSLGFDLYAGRFLCKPAKLKEALPVNRLAMIRLLARLQDPDITMPDLEKAISQDVSLSYKLLRHSNSVAAALPRSVSSIGHAIRLVGMQLLQTWASTLLLSSIEDKPRELMTIALIRARMCERLAESVKKPGKDSFALAGLLSVLDALLDCSIEQAVVELPLSDDVRSAVVEQAGSIGQALRCTIAYEQADWDAVHFYGLSPALIRDIYMEAITWSRRLVSGLL